MPAILSRPQCVKSMVYKVTSDLCFTYPGIVTRWTLCRAYESQKGVLVSSDNPDDHAEFKPEPDRRYSRWRYQGHSDAPGRGRPWWAPGPSRHALWWIGIHAPTIKRSRCSRGSADPAHGGCVGLVHRCRGIFGQLQSGSGCYCFCAGNEVGWNCAHFIAVT